MGISVVVGRVNAIHCGLPDMSVCTRRHIRAAVYGQPSVRVLVNTFDLLENAIGQLERAIRSVL